LKTWPIVDRSSCDVKGKDEFEELTLVCPEEEKSTKKKLAEGSKRTGMLAAALTRATVEKETFSIPFWAETFPGFCRFFCIKRKVLTEEKGVCRRCPMISVPGIHPKWAWRHDRTVNACSSLTPKHAPLFCPGSVGKTYA